MKDAVFFVLCRQNVRKGKWCQQEKRETREVEATDQLSNFYLLPSIVLLPLLIIILLPCLVLCGMGSSLFSQRRKNVRHLLLLSLTKIHSTHTSF